MRSIAVGCLILLAVFHTASSNTFTSLFGSINSEMPPFDVVTTGKTYEVRRYRPQLWAEIDYTVDPKTDFGDKTNIGFQPLFKYITGENERQQKIPMTAPVVMQQLTTGPGHRRMAFIMPASQFSTRDQLPNATNPEVKLVLVDKPLVFGCIKFNMGLTSKRVAARTAELREATRADHIELINEEENVRVFGYNPPWTLPWFRRNEVCIPLADQA